MATFLDIFAGIGGMRRGLESAGHRCVGYIEWDKWARKSYEAIFETKGEWTASDVTTVRAGDLPTADIWTFGFPCQDLSVAGRQLGFNGNRSSLFFTVVGLIRELPEDSRPEWLIAENVMGFFSSNRGYDFLAAQVALDEIGYDVEWEVFNATQLGIPQNRQRVFLVGHSRRHGRREVFPLRVNDCKTAAQLRCVGMLDKPGHEMRRRVYDPSGSCPTINTMQRGGDEPKVMVSAVLTPDRAEKRQNGRRFKDDGEPMFTLTSQDRHGVMVSMKDGFIGHTEVSHCLMARDYKGIGNQAMTGDASHADTRIRKLTPLECWRLMGRTDDDFHAAKNTGISDTQLYKQAGNSLIPQIVQAIGERIAELSETEVVTV